MILLQGIQRTQGTKGLILYLKSCSVSLQQAIGGQVHPNSLDLGSRISRTRSGLPRVIPARHRILISNQGPGYAVWIRFYLTVFSMYRVIPLVGRPKFNTITDPGVWYDANALDKFIPKFLKLFVRFDIAQRLELSRFFKFFVITKSSPQTSWIFFSPFKRMKALWSSHPLAVIEAGLHLREWRFGWDFIKEVSSWLRVTLALLLGMLERFPSLTSIIADAWGPEHPQVGNPTLNLGKLAFKEEPAGKVRVFAMVDALTQWLLYPLHKLLFSLLRRVPMDGTFNQVKPIYRLMRLSRKRHLPFYSLDLSAATDRLPVNIQARLLDFLISEFPFFGQKWAAFLTSRDYWYSSPKFGKGRLRYAVGQPMGALSSWAMLAFTHHFLVQVSAWRAGFPHNKLFTRYAVLGDDIVIGDTKVAKAYITLMDEIGVQIGLAKSLISPKGKAIEFAKKTFINSIDVSPISLLELEKALTDLSSWSAFSQKYQLSFDRACRVLGFGYLARRKSFRKLNHALQCVVLSSVMKVDFTTDHLRLWRGAKFLDFDNLLLGIFRDTVLKPIKSQVLRQMNSLTWGVQGDVDRILDRSWDPSFKAYSKRQFKDLHHTISFSEILRIQKSLSQVFDYLDLLKIKDFDEALSLYVKVLREKAVMDFKYLTLEGVARRPKPSVLPFQVRIFRTWSRQAFKIIHLYRKNTTLP